MYPLTCLQNALFHLPSGYTCMHFSIGSPCAKIDFARGPLSYVLPFFKRILYGTWYIERKEKDMFKSNMIHIITSDIMVNQN